MPIVPSSTSITGISQVYNIFNQTETISVQVSAGALTVNQGQVTITDGGHGLGGVKPAVVADAYARVLAFVNKHTR